MMTDGVPDPALGPWMDAGEIQADPELPFRYVSVKWILAHVAPDDRKKLGRRVLWRRSAVERWTRNWERGQESRTRGNGARDGGRVP
jgi:hypothetical protein